jgi:hypothetical protein
MILRRALLYLTRKDIPVGFIEAKNIGGNNLEGKYKRPTLISFKYAKHSSRSKMVDRPQGQDVII